MLSSPIFDRSTWGESEIQNISTNCRSIENSAICNGLSLLVYLVCNTFRGGSSIWNIVFDSKICAGTTPIVTTEFHWLLYIYGSCLIQQEWKERRLSQLWVFNAICRANGPYGFWRKIAAMSSNYKGGDIVSGCLVACLSLFFRCDAWRDSSTQWLHIIVHLLL